MKVVLSWLRDFIDLDRPAGTIAETLTTAGMKVERIQKIGEDIDGIVVGEVLQLAPHPGADKLVIVKVDTGSRELDIVCGASNFSVGDRVPVAQPGAVLPGIGVLQARKFRGVTSEGMLCSARELGAGTDHSGIMVLPAGSEPGADVRDILGAGDTVLELEITPNRPDAMSLMGIARELAACTGAGLKDLPVGLDEAGPPVSELITVRLEDPAGCPRYLARVIQTVSIGPSPGEVQRRLRLAGIRPISNVVDATNYALLVTGHPMHAFDLAKLSGATIVVRRAAPAETLVAIDGSELRLDPDDVVIADELRPVALAGIMGGRDTEVGGSTTAVALESAYFDPAAIFRASQRHLIRTESSARFERGADPGNVDFAAGLAASLIVQWAGGSLARGKVDVYPEPLAPREVAVSPERVNLLLGTSLEITEMSSALGRLGLQPEHRDGRIVVQAPTRRRDLIAEEDLIEEIARLVGYDKIPSSLPSGRGRTGALTRQQRMVRRLKTALAAAGFFEARNSILTSPADFAWSAPGTPITRLSNPLSEEESVLRGSLLPGLARSAARNFSRRNTEVRLFEVGNVFAESEVPRLGLVIGGVAPQQWYQAARGLDFYDLKGAVETIEATLSLPATGLRSPADIGAFHGPESAQLSVDGSPLGVFGRLSDAVASALDFEHPVYAAEFDLSGLLEKAGPDASARSEAARYPAVLVDLAVAVPEEVRAADIIATARRAGGDILESLRVIDVYRGQQVGAGKKSIAIAMVFRRRDRTLKDDEAMAARDAAASEIEQRHGGTIRR